MLKIFVSSVMEGLEKERESSKEAIEELIFNPELFEIFPASASSPEELCLDRVKECNIFILILKDKITEIVVKEFETAKKNKKEILIFLKEDTGNKYLKNFLDIIKDDYVYKLFKSNQNFKNYIKESIQSLLVKKFKILEDFKIEKRPVITLIDDEYPQAMLSKKMFYFEAEKGEEIRGIIYSVNDNKFSGYFYNEENYSRFLNNMPCEGIIKEDVISLHINTIPDKNDTYYLILKNINLNGINLNIKIRKIKYLH